MSRIDELIRMVKEFEDQKTKWNKEIAYLEDAIEEMNLRLDLIHEELDAELEKVNEINTK
jgi:hypothetical protein